MRTTPLLALLIWAASPAAAAPSLTPRQVRVAGFMGAASRFAAAAQPLLQPHRRQSFLAALHAGGRELDEGGLAAMAPLYERALAPHLEAARAEEPSLTEEAALERAHGRLLKAMGRAEADARAASARREASETARTMLQDLNAARLAAREEVESRSAALLELSLRRVLDARSPRESAAFLREAEASLQRTSFYGYDEAGFPSRGTGTSGARLDAALAQLRTIRFLSEREGVRDRAAWLARLKKEAAAGLDLVAPAEAASTVGADGAAAAPRAAGLSKPGPSAPRGDPLSRARRRLERERPGAEVSEAELAEAIRGGRFDSLLRPLAFAPAPGALGEAYRAALERVSAFGPRSMGFQARHRLRRVLQAVPFAALVLALLAAAVLGTPAAAAWAAAAGLAVSVGAASVLSAFPTPLREIRALVRDRERLGDEAVAQRVLALLLEDPELARLLGMPSGDSERQSTELHSFRKALNLLKVSNDAPDVLAGKLVREFLHDVGKGRAYVESQAKGAPGTTAGQFDLTLGVMGRYLPWMGFAPEETARHLEVVGITAVGDYVAGYKSAEDVLAQVRGAAAGAGVPVEALLDETLEYYLTDVASYTRERGSAASLDALVEFVDGRPRFAPEVSRKMGVLRALARREAPLAEPGQPAMQYVRERRAAGSFSAAMAELNPGLRVLDEEESVHDRHLRIVSLTGFSMGLAEAGPAAREAYRAVIAEFLAALSVELEAMGWPKEDVRIVFGGTTGNAGEVTGDQIISEEAQKAGYVLRAAVPMGVTGFRPVFAHELVFSGSRIGDERELVNGMAHAAVGVGGGLNTKDRLLDWMRRGRTAVAAVVPSLGGASAELAERYRGDARLKTGASGAELAKAVAAELREDPVVGWIGSLRRRTNVRGKAIRVASASDMRAALRRAGGLPEDAPLRVIMGASWTDNPAAAVLGDGEAESLRREFRAALRALGPDVALALSLSNKKGTPESILYEEVRALGARRRFQVLGLVAEQSMEQEYFDPGIADVIVLASQGWTDFSAAAGRLVDGAFSLGGGVGSARLVTTARALKRPHVYVDGFAPQSDAILRLRGIEAFPRGRLAEPGALARRLTEMIRGAEPQPPSRPGQTQEEFAADLAQHLDFVTRAARRNPGLRVYDKGARAQFDNDKILGVFTGYSSGEDFEPAEGARFASEFMRELPGELARAGIDPGLFVPAHGATDEGEASVIGREAVLRGIPVMGVTTMASRKYEPAPMTGLTVLGRGWGDDSDPMTDIADVLFGRGGGGQALAEMLLMLRKHGAGSVIPVATGKGKGASHEFAALMNAVLQKDGAAAARALVEFLKTQRLFGWIAELKAAGGDYSSAGRLRERFPDGFIVHMAGTAEGEGADRWRATIRGLASAHLERKSADSSSPDLVFADDGSLAPGSAAAIQREVLAEIEASLAGTGMAGFKFKRAALASSEELLADRGPARARRLEVLAAYDAVAVVSREPARSAYGTVNAGDFLITGGGGLGAAEASRVAETVGRPQLRLAGLDPFMDGMAARTAKAVPTGPEAGRELLGIIEDRVFPAAAERRRDAAAAAARAAARTRAAAKVAAAVLLTAAFALLGAALGAFLVGAAPGAVAAWGVAGLLALASSVYLAVFRFTP